MVSVEQIAILAPEILLVIGVSALLVYGATPAGSAKGGQLVMRESVVWLGALLLFLGGILSLSNRGVSGPLLYGSLYHDNLTATGKGLIFIFGGLVLLASASYLREEGLNPMEYPIIIVISSLGLGLLLSAYDLMSLYLGLELQSLGLYVLATFKRGSSYSTEAGLKYFIVGALGSGLLLFGSSLIYGELGTTNLEDIGRLTLGLGDASFALQSGLVLLSAGLLFKLAAAPFHMWSPDVYEGAPTSASLFFAAVPKIAILGVLVRLYYTSFYDWMPLWQTGLMGASMASLIVAALGALYQRRIKRFLAYSSIGHVGYLLMGVSCGTVEGLQGVYLYTIIYMVMSLNVWTVLLVSRVQFMDELAGMGRGGPWLAGTVAVVIFSMAGIPPLAGFFAKMDLFFAAMEGSLYALAIVGVLTSVVSAFYYLRWVKILFFEGGYGGDLGTNDAFAGRVGEAGSGVAMDRATSLILATTTTLLLVYFLAPGPFQLMAQQMALGA